MKRLFIFTIIFCCCNSISFSQNTPSSDGHFVEPSYQAGSLLNSYASFLDLNVGKEIRSKYSVGLAFHILISELKTAPSSGNEKMSKFWYLGPRFTYNLHSVNSFTYYLGSSAGFGASNYSDQDGNTVVSGGFVYGVEPELGARYQITDHLKLDLKACLFYGSVGNFKTFASPSIRIGVRFIK